MRSKFLFWLFSPAFLQAETIQIDLPELPLPIKISLPENHQPGKKHPTIFYYHGTNGRPTTTLIREHAGPNDWTVVGMTYKQKGKFTLTPETFDAERKAYHAARKLMIDRYGTDPDHIYLAGFSKGGWHTNLMLQSEPTVSGGIIMGAGHLHQAPGSIKRYQSKKPVHIGIGRADGNYPFALGALLHHREMGGVPSMEVWPDLGHNFPSKGSAPIKQWLKMRVTPTDELEKTAVAELDKLIDSSQLLKPLEKWEAMREVREMPYFKITPNQWREKFQKSLDSLEKTPEVSIEAKILLRHQQLLYQEITDNTLSSLKKVNHLYLQLSGKHQSSRQAKFLKIDFQRTSKLLKHFEEQERLKPQPSKPKPLKTPNIRDRIPRSPLIK